MNYSQNSVKLLAICLSVHALASMNTLYPHTLTASDPIPLQDYACIDRCIAAAISKLVTQEWKKKVQREAIGCGNQ